MLRNPKVLFPLKKRLRTRCRYFLTAMPPAARIGDLTSHGTPLTPGPGSNNVLIGGRPALRALSDMHACPLVDGLKPHVGGMISTGSKTVFINNLPAARVGDMIVEAGAPSTIAIGAPNVIIGDSSTGGTGPPAHQDNFSDQYIIELMDSSYMPIKEKGFNVSGSNKISSKGGLVTLRKSGSSTSVKLEDSTKI